MTGMFTDFRDKTVGTAEACSLANNTDSEFRVVIAKLEDVRREQAALLQPALVQEEENCRLAQLLPEGQERKRSCVFSLRMCLRAFCSAFNRFGFQCVGCRKYEMV